MLKGAAGAGRTKLRRDGDGITRVKVGYRIADCFDPRWFGGRRHSSGRAARCHHAKVEQRILRLKILHCGIRKLIILISVKP